VLVDGTGGQDLLRDPNRPRNNRNTHHTTLEQGLRPALMAGRDGVQVDRLVHLDQGRDGRSLKVTEWNTCGLQPADDVLAPPPAKRDRDPSTVAPPLGYPGLYGIAEQIRPFFKLGTAEVSSFGVPLKGTDDEVVCWQA